jgi:ABC-type antimicrobial peptide transport system permease subunit
VYDVRTMEEFYRTRMLSLFNAVNGLIVSMGTMGLGLALVGLYGLVAYGVKRRTHEIGIRMAIGADAGRLVRLVAAQGVLLSVGGLAVGLAFSGAVGHAVAWKIPFSGVARQTDAAALATVSVVVFVVTLLATYIPARRASRINPTEALRYE